MTNQEAHDYLADVIFWLKGFSAASKDSDAGDDVAMMISQLNKVQEFVGENNQ